MCGRCSEKALSSHSERRLSCSPPAFALLKFMSGCGRFQNRDASIKLGRPEKRGAKPLAVARGPDAEAPLESAPHPILAAEAAAHRHVL